MNTCRRSFNSKKKKSRQMRPNGLKRSSSSKARSLDKERNKETQLRTRSSDTSLKNTGSDNINKKRFITMQVVFRISPTATIFDLDEYDQESDIQDGLSSGSFSMRSQSILSQHYPRRLAAGSKTYTDNTGFSAIKKKIKSESCSSSCSKPSIHEWQQLHTWDNKATCQRADVQEELSKRIGRRAKNNCISFKYFE